MLARKLLVWSCALAALAAAGCGDDDDASTPDADADAANVATAAPEAEVASTTCPSAADVSVAFGAEMQLDEANASTGALGLMFCPYEEVLPPDTTDRIGMPVYPKTFSITFTNQDIVVSDEFTEDVPGLGEKATWQESGELDIWTGERGIIISSGLESRDSLIAVAQLLV